MTNQPKPKCTCRNNYFEKMGYHQYACDMLKQSWRATEVGAKPTAGRKQDLPGASPSDQDNNFEQELIKKVKEFLYDEIEYELENDSMSKNVWEYGDNGLRTTLVWREKALKALIALIQSSLEEAVRLARTDELLEMRAVGDKYVTGSDISFEGLSGVYDNHILKRCADLTKGEHGV